MCRAALHDGVIDNKGGKIFIEKVKGLPSYEESTRNGVKSNKYGSSKESFRVYKPKSKPSGWETVMKPELTDHTSTFEALEPSKQTDPFHPKGTEVNTESGGKKTKKPIVNGQCSTSAKQLAEPLAEVLCPSGCHKHPNNVWGTGFYNYESSICQAAIHWGILSPEDSKVIIVERIPGQKSYEQSTRNGITSKSFGASPWSIKVRLSIEEPEEPDREPFRLPAGKSSCSLSALEVKDRSAEMDCPSDCMKDKSPVYGSGTYASVSSMCRAALHDGVIDNKGGKIFIEKVKGLPSYEESTRNGVKSNKYGSSKESFRVYKPKSKPSGWETVKKPELTDHTSTFEALEPSKQTDPFHPKGTEGNTESGGKKTKKPIVNGQCSTSAKQLAEPLAEVLCPSGCHKHPNNVWGTGFYNYESSICQAAIHWGILSPEDSKVIIVEIIPGQKSYEQSTRNGITSKSFGASPWSFKVRLSIEEPEEPDREPFRLPAGKSSCSLTALQVKDRSAEMDCPSDCMKAKSPVYGSGTYASVSSMCRAALHDGVIDNKGGKIFIEKVKGLPSYEESTRNGVKSNKYGSSKESFRVYKPKSKPSGWETVKKPELTDHTSTFEALEPSKQTDPFHPKGTEVNTESGGKKTKKPIVNGQCSTSAKQLAEPLAEVLCPSGCHKHPNNVWGTGFYNYESSICQAAIHWGILSPEDSKVIIVERIQGQKSYEQSTRNGITSKSFGASPWSFKVRLSIEEPEEPDREPFRLPAGKSSCSLTALEVKDRSAEMDCPSDCMKDKSPVYGIGTYASVS
ncbi:uncharacterized protein [Ranitomeya imitator]|uniref:uncharacterized protein n=1 Tax=Ranitomeya imitator TaxID=111125 RepID=UPI0037E7750F